MLSNTEALRRSDADTQKECLPVAAYSVSSKAAKVKIEGTFFLSE